jgi:hypothetical protein
MVCSKKKIFAILKILLTEKLHPGVGFKKTIDGSCLSHSKKIGGHFCRTG